jgi:hypothetical protein
MAHLINYLVAAFAVDGGFDSILTQGYFVAHKISVTC